MTEKKREFKCENAHYAYERGMLNLAAECDCEECNEVLRRGAKK